MTAQFIPKLVEDILFPFYPPTCMVCNSLLVDNERDICIGCMASMPITNYHTQRDNPIEQLFWGKHKVEAATSFFAYNKDSNYRFLLYNLKYKGQQNIGKSLGKLQGNRLLSNPRFPIDCIIPVPLHPAKLRKRGYNQSECIAKGIAQVLQKPILTKAIRRTHNNSSQTKKHKYERFTNSKGLFEISNPKSIQAKHILIVDDVVTTGSTLDSLLNEIKPIENTQCYIATLAYA